MPDNARRGITIRGRFEHTSTGEAHPLDVSRRAWRSSADAATCDCTAPHSRSRGETGWPQSTDHPPRLPSIVAMPATGRGPRRAAPRASSTRDTLSRARRTARPRRARRVETSHRGPRTAARGRLRRSDSGRPHGPNTRRAGLTRCQRLRASAPSKGKDGSGWWRAWYGAVAYCAQSRSKIEGGSGIERDRERRGRASPDYSPAAHNMKNSRCEFYRIISYYTNGPEE